MSKTDNLAVAPKPFFTLAAWSSLFVPLIATAVYLYLNNYRQGPSPKWISPVMFLIYTSSFVLGCVGIVGIKWNSAWAILPPALLGLPINTLLATLALIFWLLSGLPGP
jgi:hypothetical protein